MEVTIIAQTPREGENVIHIPELPLNDAVIRLANAKKLKDKIIPIIPKFSFSSCNLIISPYDKHVGSEQWEISKRVIRNYLEKNNVNDKGTFFVIEVPEFFLNAFCFPECILHKTESYEFQIEWQLKWHIFLEHWESIGFPESRFFDS